MKTDPASKRDPVIAIGAWPEASRGASNRIKLEEDAIGVLSGTGSDGALGLKAIKELGGLTPSCRAPTAAPRNTMACPRSRSRPARSTSLGARIVHDFRG